jgi:hypothetical protein
MSKKLQVRKGLDLSNLIQHINSMGKGILGEKVHPENRWPFCSCTRSLVRQSSEVE